MSTKIEWVVGPDGRRGITANPIRFRNRETGAVGHHCTKISPGCANCYASRMQKPYLSGFEYTADNAAKGEFFFDDAVIERVLRLRKATGIFWCDMTDLFGDWVPDEWIDTVFAAIGLTPQHYHYILTKRAKRMVKYLSSDDLEDRITDLWAGDDEDKQTCSLMLPLPNVRLGVSCEDQPRADERINELLKLAAMGWKTMVSCEPLIGPITFRWAKWDDGAPHPRRITQFPDVQRGGKTIAGCQDHLDGLRMLDWVIVGGESGPGARPMHPDWARSIRDQCRSAGVPFFFKQWGEWLPDDQLDCSTFVIARGHPGAPAWAITKPVRHLDSGLHAFRLGKRAAGNLLDGREWMEFPEGDAA